MTGRRKAAAVLAPIVLKLGGELLEEPARLQALSRAIVRAAKRAPLVVVHGGGREIDQALATAGIPKRQVDGLRITDEATLGVVVGVLGGTINTRFVAALNAAGGRAVGLTGADAGVAPSRPAPPLVTTDGRTVDLGRVGQPVMSKAPALVDRLTTGGFLPVVASVAASRDGRLFNVNADTLASNLAVRLKASRLVIAGATPGVRDEAGTRIEVLDVKRVGQLITSGTANAGMVAKLHGCRAAILAGVDEVVIADGRDAADLAQALRAAPLADGPWTRVVRRSRTEK